MESPNSNSGQGIFYPSKPRLKAFTELNYHF